jgi:hypothetical protein
MLTLPPLGIDEPGYQGPPFPETCYTAEQAAERLGISPQRVRVLLAQGRLSGFLLRRGSRDVWCVHKSLYRRPGAAGRPRTKRRKAAAGDGGSEAKP